MPQPPDRETALAIICGGGTLPFALADAAIRRGRRVVLFALREWADPQRVAAYPHHWTWIGQFGLATVGKIPGLKKFVAARVLGTPTGAAPYSRVAELYFESNDSLQSAMASPGAQATVAHAVEISTGGPPVVLIAEDD